MWLWWAASLGSPRRPAAEGTRDGCSARAVDCVTGPSRRALCLTSLSHRQNRLACHSSYGARGREVQGILEGSVGATGRPSRLETTTFGEGGKNVTARATHNLILKQVLHNSPQPRRPPAPRSRGRDEGRQRVVGVEAPACRLLLRRRGCLAKDGVESGIDNRCLVARPALARRLAPARRRRRHERRQRVVGVEAPAWRLLLRR